MDFFYGFLSTSSFIMAFKSVYQKDCLRFIEDLICCCILDSPYVISFYGRLTIETFKRVREGGCYGSYHRHFFRIHSLGQEYSIDVEVEKR